MTERERPPCIEPVTVFICGDKPCDCDCDGPVVVFTDEETGKFTGASASCSKCGRTALDRSIWNDD
jgi:hypothetical protein